MTDRAQYTPGPASGARIQKEPVQGSEDKWTLVLVRELRHSSEKRLAGAHRSAASSWSGAPFEADGSLATVGNTVKLTTVGAPTPQVSETKSDGEPTLPRRSEYNWGGFDIRWELEGFRGGTRLTLWHNINRRFISMGAAGWHICLDVSGSPSRRKSNLGRIVGGDAMKFDWQRLNVEYARQFGIEAPSWPPKAAQKS